MVALTAATYREAMQNTNVGEQGKSRKQNRGRPTQKTPQAIMAKPLSEARLKDVYGTSGNSTPQPTLTPQSSCADLDTSSSSASSQRDFVECVSRPQREEQTMPCWLRQNGSMENSCKTAQVYGGKGSIRDSLRARGQQSMMAVLGGDVDQLTRFDLQARGDAVLASVRESPGSGSSEAMLGHLTVATMLPGARNALRMGGGGGGWSGCGAVAPQLWQQSPQPFSPPGMWWPGCADNVRLPDFDDQPMKVNLDGCPSAMFTLAPPPGL